MAYFHDLAEYIVFDYTPADNIKPEEKHQLERKALEELLANTGDQGR